MPYSFAADSFSHTETL